MLTLEEITNNIKPSSTVIGIVNPIDDEIFEAIANAVAWCYFHLYGPAKAIIKKLEAKKITSSKITITDCDSNLACTTAVINACNNSLVDIIMKGTISTKELLQAILNKKQQLYKQGQTLSHVAIIEIPTYHKIIFLSDSALNIAPNQDQFINIINNVLQITQSLKIKQPKIALLAANEKESDKMPITKIWKKISHLPKETWIAENKIQGPLSLDTAINHYAAQIKNIKNDVVGDADILIVPNIESGNILYKSLTYFAHAIASGIIIGAKIPIILTSRADTYLSKLAAIACCLQINSYQEGN